ncbi:hypothetical protein LTR22_024822 [Elasticomyces elasticus]|nr:hypothetical protein LTR22_024822 [Elasticomyces elasticus]KAK4901453.1 hypothetical protein LTR49_027249 [Elasticomyces elasticus]
MSSNTYNGRSSEHGRLPRSDDQPNIVDIYQSNLTGDASDVQIVFISYRWIGRSSQPPVNGPEDIENTQYLRMCDAVERLLEETNINGDRDGLWLDIACIDQQHEAAKRRGIASLPLIIAQCDSERGLGIAEYENGEDQNIRQEMVAIKAYYKHERALLVAKRQVLEHECVLLEWKRQALDHELALADLKRQESEDRLKLSDVKLATINANYQRATAWASISPPLPPP